MAGPPLRDAIADLVHRYSDAVTRRDLDQWASCWSTEGRWEISAERVATDPQARLELLQLAFDVLDAVVQLTVNGSVVAGGPETASGRWYIVEHFRRAGEAGMLIAHYDDRYVHVDGQWYFAARTLVPHYKGSPDLSGVFGHG